MLVLTRKVGEGVVIGDEIRVTVVEIKGGGIRLGIEAPAAVKIHRQEVYEKILNENKEAAKWSLVDLNELSVNLGSSKEKV